MTDQIRLLLLFLCNSSHLFLIQAIVFECKSTDPCGCSRNNVDIDSRIIGGETVAYRSWGWAVSVRNSYNEHICGGTILSKYFVLTAAHSIAVGMDSLFSTTGQIRIVFEIIIHPKWNFTTKENDIALLKLTTPISMDDINIAKICLPDVTKFQQIRYPKLNSSLVTIGWGITAWEDFISPMYLRQVTLQTIDTTETKCNKIIKNVNVQFCAAVKGGEKGNQINLLLFNKSYLFHFRYMSRRFRRSDNAFFIYKTTLDIDRYYIIRLSMCST
jgi:secreted trypsin-like serine protease